ncbi:hypothetical protein JYU34_018302 [Plutella xylostella]|uniref:Uncharacterized protein n=1 Tax=Plutella xylostella TaxID=51655 RepID=A0ABQ7Q084_PLUXY|nr:hypothetical protein JYU34_018302 [Plutella xylostella]
MQGDLPPALPRSITEKDKLPATWICVECKRHVPRDNRADTPVRGAPSQVEPDVNEMVYTAEVSGNTAASDLTEETKVELGLEIPLFRDELRAVREEIRTFRTEMSDLRSAMSEADSRLTKMDARVVELETKMAESGTGKLEEMIGDLKLELQEKDQDMLLNQARIHPYGQDGHAHHLNALPYHNHNTGFQYNNFRVLWRSLGEAYVQQWMIIG